MAHSPIPLIALIALIALIPLLPYFRKMSFIYINIYISKCIYELFRIIQRNS